MVGGSPTEHAALRPEADAGRLRVLDAGYRPGSPRQSTEIVDGRPPRRVVYALRSAVTGAATDTRKTAGTAGQAVRTRELAAGAASDPWNTALPARPAAGAAVLAAGPAVAVGVTATAAGILLEDHVRGCSHGRASCERFSCRHRGNSNRRSNGSAHYQWFHQV